MVHHKIIQRQGTATAPEIPEFLQIKQSCTNFLSSRINLQRDVITQISSTHIVKDVCVAKLDVYVNLDVVLGDQLMGWFSIDIGKTTKNNFRKCC